jgi:hypothetical protein
MKKLTLFLALSLMGFVAQAQKAVGYNYRKLVSVTTGQFTGTLTNFPVAVRISDPDLALGDGVIHPNGWDIAFCDLTGELYRFEIESYEPDGDLVAWVLLPSSTSGTTQFYMVYGNATINSDPSTSATWNTNFQQVYHMVDESNSALSGGAAVNNGTNPNTGILWLGQEFNGGVNWELGNMALPNTLTISGWIYASGLSGEHGIVCNAGFGSTGYGLMVKSTGSEEYDLVFRSTYTNKGTAIHSNTTASAAILGETWHHVAARITNGNPRTVVLFVDGKTVASGTINNATTLGGNQFMGSLYDPTAPGPNDFFPGLMDEMNIQYTSASTEWIRATYNNQREGSNFLSFGPEDRIPYITSKNGNWASAGWLQWGAAAPAPGNDATVTIAHNVSINQVVNVHQTTINASRTLIIQPLFSLTSNLLTNNGTLFIQANSTGYGQLGPSSSIAGGGTYTIEGYLAGTVSNSNWRHLISPINTTLGQLSDDFNTLTFSNSNQGSVWYYDPTISKWQAPSGSSQSFASQGFTIFAGTNNGTTYSNLPLTFDVSGTAIRNGAQSFTLQYDNPIDPTPGAGSFGWYTANDGWNFAGNPYPSAVDWVTAYNQAPSRPADMTPWVYVWDGMQNAYRAYNAVTGVSQNGGTRYIAPFQAVYLKMNASGSAGTPFTFVNTARSVTNFPALARTNETTTPFEDELILSVQRNDQAQANDNLTLGFHTQATDDYDVIFDGFKFHRTDAGSVNFYSIAERNSQNTSLCYNTLGVDNSQAKAVDLGFEHDQNGAQFHITAAQFNSSMYQKMELEDLLTGSRHNLLTAGPYHFAYVASAPKIRFRLHLETTSMGNETLALSDPKVYQSGDHIRIELPQTARQLEVEIYDLSGRLLHQSQANNLNETSVATPDMTGLALVRLTIDGASSTHKLMIP